MKVWVTNIVDEFVDVENLNPNIWNSETRAKNSSKILLYATSPSVQPLPRFFITALQRWVIWPNCSRSLTLTLYVCQSIIACLSCVYLSQVNNMSLEVDSSGASSPLRFIIVDKTPGVHVQLVCQAPDQESRNDWVVQLRSLLDMQGDFLKGSTAFIIVSPWYNFM